MPPATTTTEAYWHHFLPTVEKLLKEKHEGKIKHQCVGEDWWSSRYSDFLTNTNSAAKSDEDYQFRKAGYAVWNEIWAKYAHIMEEVNK